MNLVKRLTASIVVITYQIFLKLIHGLRFLDQTSDMNVDHTSNPRASLLPSHPYREGFAFGSQVNVGSSCLRSQAGRCFDFILLCAVQKTRVKSFQIRSRFSLPLYVQAVSLVFVCSSSLNVLGWFKKKMYPSFSVLVWGFVRMTYLSLLDMKIVPPSILHTGQTYLIQIESCLGNLSA